MGYTSLTAFPNGITSIVPGQPATGVGLSPDIWFDCPLYSMQIDPALGVVEGDNFTRVQATGFPYELIGTNGTFAAVADAPYGNALLSAPTGADNNEAHLAFNNDVGGMIKCNVDKPWWFETRIKLSQIAAEGGVFIGLLEQGASADAIMADDTMILTATLDAIGFQIVEAAANAAPNWRTMMQLAARAAVSETAAVASTNFVKLGMKSVPNTAGTSATVYFFVNGSVLADAAVDTDTDFPLDKVLIPHWGVKTGKNAAFSITLDWWKGAQLR